MVVSSTHSSVSLSKIFGLKCLMCMHSLQAHMDLYILYHNRREVGIINRFVTGGDVA